ncbi:hypothetical protein [Winogradskyella sp.]|uniref:hypothetical protein n=1 Tax=Winogradskyella sp. TaxID=1883156 RepID=UPI002629E5E0|nr:hypothetical protein [Winogradskyella sp.]
METNKDITDKIEATLNSVDTIEEVSVSPFFKGKAMRQIFAEQKQEPKVLWSWLTPQVQLATLVLIVAINVFAVMQLRNESYDNEISNFAESYGLTEDASESLID